MPSSSPAVLLDVDGTLVDTSYFHAIAWYRALRDAGETVPTARLHRLVGMDADRFTAELFGSERQDLSDGHSRHIVPLHDETGGWSPAELRAAGAVAVHLDSAGLAREFDAGPLADLARRA